MPRSAAGYRPLSFGSWATFAALLLHVAEEFPNFPEWATEHFGTTTPEWYILSHLPLLLLAAWICYRASRPLPTTSSVWFLLALQSALFVNAAFHVTVTIWFREYSPGVVSAVLLYLPVTIFLTAPAVAALGSRRSMGAGATGVLVSSAAVATLWLP